MLCFVCRFLFTFHVLFLLVMLAANSQHLLRRPRESFKGNAAATVRELLTSSGEKFAGKSAMAPMARPFILLLQVATADAWATWCAWVPVPLQRSVNGCMDYLGDPHVDVAGKEGCADWCRWVPVLAWHYPEGCSGCGGGSAAMSVDRQSARTRPSAQDSVDGLPEWCRWVPQGALQHVSSCDGYKSVTLLFSSGCESYCEWVPKPAWQFPKGCQNCGMAAHDGSVSEAPFEFIP